MIWRVGRSLGRTLYRDEVLVGMVDTPEIAAAIVEAMNADELLVGKHRIECTDNTCPGCAQPDDLLHPTGRCTCGGEGCCSWCMAHCTHCGAGIE